MKIKVKDLVLFFILLIVFFDSRFMGIIKIPDTIYAFMGNTSRVLVAILTIVLFLICFRLYKNSNAFKNRFINSYIVVLLLSISFIFIFTLYAYSKQPINATFKYFVQYTIPLLIYPIFVYLHYSDDKSFFKAMNVYVNIFNIVLLVQAYFFNLGGKIIIHEFANPEAIQFGLIRMSLSPLNPIMILYNFTNLYTQEKRHKLYSLLSFILGLYAVLYVQRSRAEIAILVTCILIYLFVQLRNRKTALVSLFLITSAIIFVLNTTYVKAFIDSFFSNERSISTLARIYGYKHYWNVFISNPFTGFGFARNNEYFNVVHGDMGLAYIDDVGIVGQMASMGIFALIIYIPIIARLFYVYLKTKDKYIMLIFTYILFSSATLICLDSQRIIVVPIILSITEYRYRKFITTPHNDIFDCAKIEKDC